MTDFKETLSDVQLVRQEAVPSALPLVAQATGALIEGAAVVRDKVVLNRLNKGITAAKDEVTTLESEIAESFDRATGVAGQINRFDQVVEEENPEEVLILGRLNADLDALTNSVNQGVSKQREATIRAQSLVTDFISNNPSLGTEARQLFRGQFSSIGGGVSSGLGTPALDARDDADEAFLKDVRTLENTLGISTSQAFKLVQQEATREMNTKLLEQRIKIGDASANDIRTVAGLTSSELSGRVMSQVLSGFSALQQAGGFGSQETLQSFENLISASRAELNVGRTQALASIDAQVRTARNNGVLLDASEIQASREDVNKHFDGQLALISGEREDIAKGLESIQKSLGQINRDDIAGLLEEAASLSIGATAFTLRQGAKALTASSAQDFTIALAETMVTINLLGRGDFETGFRLTTDLFASDTATRPRSPATGLVLLAVKALGPSGLMKLGSERFKRAIDAETPQPIVPETETDGPIVDERVIGEDLAFNAMGDKVAAAIANRLPGDAPERLALLADFGREGSTELLEAGGRTLYNNLPIEGQKATLNVWLGQAQEASSELVALASDVAASTRGGITTVINTAGGRQRINARGIDYDISEEFTTRDAKGNIVVDETSVNIALHPSRRADIEGLGIAGQLFTSAVRREPARLNTIQFFTASAVGEATLTLRPASEEVSDPAVFTGEVLADTTDKLNVLLTSIYFYSDDGPAIVSKLLDQMSKSVARIKIAS